MAHIDRIDTAATAATFGTAVLERPSFGVVAMALFGALMVASLVVAPLTLALLGAAMLGAGLLLATGLWLTGSALQERARARDVAGLLVFLGFAAGIMCGAGAFLS